MMEPILSDSEGWREKLAILIQRSPPPWAKPADANIRQPATTRRTMRKARGLSMRERFAMDGSLPGRKCDDHSRKSQYDGEYPVAHYNLGSRPADCLKMMMQGGHSEQLPAKKTLGDHLSDVGEDCCHQHRAYDG